MHGALCVMCLGKGRMLATALQHGGFLEKLCGRLDQHMDNVQHVACYDHCKHAQNSHRC